MSPYVRSQISTLRGEGISIRDISERINISENTVKWTLKSDPRRDEGKSLKRIGRPIKYTERDTRRIIHFVQINPKSSYEDIRRSLHISLSHDTLGRILDSVGIKNWRAKGRPALESADAKVRNNWALTYNIWDVEWESIIFSDECSVERGKGGQREWVFRLPSQKWDKKMVQTYKKSTDISIMVWGAIWVGGRSDLVIMDRDEDTQGGGYSANSYLAVLEQEIPKCYTPGRVFMQDNASIHTAKKIVEWFENNAVILLDWPPYSPDMNPIEHVWAKMKEWIIKTYPELSTMGKSQQAYNTLARAIEEAWNALDQEYIDNMIRGMPRRLEALTKAKGWHTKY